MFTDMNAFNLPNNHISRYCHCPPCIEAETGFKRFSNLWKKFSQPVHVTDGTQTHLLGFQYQNQQPEIQEWAPNAQLEMFFYCLSSSKMYVWRIKSLKPTEPLFSCIVNKIIWWLHNKYVRGDPKTTRISL